MQSSRTISALQVPIRTLKPFFDICRKFGPAPSKIFSCPAVEYRGFVTFRCLADVSDIDSFAAWMCKYRTTLYVDHWHNLPPVFCSSVTLPLASPLSFAAFPSCHCSSKIYNHALNNMYFNLFIADQLFSHVNKQGADSLY